MSIKIPNLIGQTFGLWTVIEQAESDKNGRKRYLCRCSCGKTKIVTADNLRRGVSTSCGHTAAEKRRADLSGRRFGRLTAIRYVRTQNSAAIWECVCDCGNVCQVAANNLRSKHTRSCGCQLIESQNDATARVAGQATSPKCSKTDTNIHAKSFVLTNHEQRWSGRNLYNFVRTHSDLFDIYPGDEHQINKVAQNLYATRRHNSSWYGWRLRWEDDHE